MIRRFALAALAAVLTHSPASALGDSHTLEALFAPLSQGACVKMDEVRAVSATVQLTPDQFQFVRAFWLATPPMSRDLPPGDKAFYAKDAQGVAILGLYGDDGQVCAVVRATDWLQRLVDEVGRGETGQLGQPM